MLLASTKIDVQQMQLAVLQQQGGIADRVIGQGVEPVFFIRVLQTNGNGQPFCQSLGKTGRNDDVGDLEWRCAVGRGGDHHQQ